MLFSDLPCCTCFVASVTSKGVFHMYFLCPRDNTLQPRLLNFTQRCVVEAFMPCVDCGRWIDKPQWLALGNHQSPLVQSKVAGKPFIIDEVGNVCVARCQLCVHFLEIIELRDLASGNEELLAHVYLLPSCDGRSIVRDAPGATAGSQGSS